MIIDFTYHQERKAVKEHYRKQLVEQINAYYLSDKARKENAFYLEHVRTGFPIHILEGILERLEIAQSESREKSS